ncbi:MAG: hypothetical protein ACP5SH_06660 [Syntrophobacteraceae bacterium]
MEELERKRLAGECAKLDPSTEKTMAEGAMEEELEQIIGGLNEIIGN